MVVMVVMVLMVDPDKSRWTLVKILEEREEKGEAGQKDKAEIVKIRKNLHLNNSHVCKIADMPGNYVFESKTSLGLDFCFRCLELQLLRT